MINSNPGNVVPTDTGNKPPTSLDIVLQANSGAASYYSQMSIVNGCLFSSTVTSATITEVLNIPGSGVITFGGLIISAATVTASKLSIEIDGVTVAEDLAIASMQDSYIAGVIGSFYASTISQATVMSEVPITFNKSLKVSIAGDGTNGVKFAYKRYLT